MRQCAFLTMDSLEGFMCYDHLLYGPMKEIGWHVTPVSWRHTKTCWDDFEIVIVRSPWDYQDDPDRFLGVLESIDNSSAHLENSLTIIRENINKLYLKKLAALGLDIVPSLFPEKLTESALTDSFRVFNAHEIIVKPIVSANAADTYRLTSENEGRKVDILNCLENRNCIIQPFVDSVVTEGEFSLFYFGGEYSHTILKTPKQNDFRVQEEHGGILQLVKPGSDILLQADKVMEVLAPVPLYARVDFVRYQSVFCIMELELIEPSLYFNMDPASPERFVKAFAKRIDELTHS